jgi:hypothetical protein
MGRWGSIGSTTACWCGGVRRRRQRQRLDSGVVPAAVSWTAAARGPSGAMTSACCENRSEMALRHSERSKWSLMALRPALLVLCAERRVHVVLQQWQSSKKQKKKRYATYSDAPKGEGHLVALQFGQY